MPITNKKNGDRKHRHEGGVQEREGTNEFLVREAKRRFAIQETRAETS